MDLYKWAAKSMPWIGSELLLETFRLANLLRDLDMRASPYDLSKWDVVPVKIETLEGRREYETEQCALAEVAFELRKLPGHFEGKYGFRPLLAEGFSDPQLLEGTLYKASNWTPLGFSKGFARHKSEFHTEQKAPKKHWVFPLQKNPRQLFSSSSPLPEIFQKGTSEGVAGARCALAHKHLRSLSDAFHSIPDHRSPCPAAFRKSACSGSSPTVFLSARP